MVGPSPDPTTTKMLDHMFEEMPLRNLITMSGGAFKKEMAEGLLLVMNGKTIRGLWKVIRSGGKIVH